MILRFDITSPQPPVNKKAAPCPVGWRMRSPMVFSAFSHAQTGGKNHGAPFLQCKKPVRRFAGPFRTCKWTEKSTADLFYNAKSQTNAFVDLFARKTGGSKDRSICKVLANHIGDSIMKVNHLISGLKATEVAGLAHTVCGLYDSCTAELKADDYLRNEMADLKGLSERLLDAFRNHRLITSLENHDTHRMRCVSALINLKRGYDKIPDESIQSHWTELKPVFENFLSAIQAGNYQSKTALIQALLRRLSDPKLSAHLEGLVDMKTTVDQLQAAEKDFEAMQVEYQHQLLEDKTESATDLKETIFELINQRLVVHLEAKCNVDADTYSTFARLVDAQVRAGNAKVRARRKVKKDTPSEIPTTE